MGEIWDYMLSHVEKCIDTRGQDYLSQIFNDIAVAMGVGDPQTARNLFCGILQEMELSSPVSETAQRSSDIAVLSSSVNPTRLKNNPVELDAITIHKLYEEIVK
jgi:hypothetical protein